MTINEFEPLSIIGRGAFGEVRVCRQKTTGNIVAIKKMKKSEMQNKNQLIHLITEKEILTNNNPWIVKLKYSFQDDYYLYLVMDYLPGGDLMNLLMKKNILTEDEARFYTAELILAVDSIHKLNCIHRDIKPDNILIDKRGHIQLSDFGLCKISEEKFFPITLKKNNNNNNSNNDKNEENENNFIKTHYNKNDKLIAFSTVGTPDYIAPEVFEQNGYGNEVDWWSVGIIFFEMIIGYPPFFSESPGDTCKKIMKWKENFSIPKDANISEKAKNLILKLIKPFNKRLGKNGVEEIKAHPFFNGIDWDNIRNIKAPFIPDLKSNYDTKYFDNFSEKEPFYPNNERKNKRRRNINYIGYSFNIEIENNKEEEFLKVMDTLENISKNEEKKVNNIHINNYNTYNPRENYITNSEPNEIINTKYPPQKKNIITLPNKIIKKTYKNINNLNLVNKLPFYLLNNKYKKYSKSPEIKLNNNLCNIKIFSYNNLNNKKKIIRDYSPNFTKLDNNMNTSIYYKKIKYFPSSNHFKILIENNKQISPNNKNLLKK